MRKQDLIKAIAKEAKMSEAQAGAALNALIDTVEKALASGDEVTISGFGSFKVSERAAREGRNPRTGETMKIPARKSPTFKAGTQLKAAVEK